MSGNSGMLIQPLDHRAKSIAHRTLSAWAFYYIVGDTLLNRKPMSTVRMGDGERLLLDACVTAAKEGRSDQVVTEYDENWRQRMGIVDITYGELYKRIRRAGTECTHFGPNISGITQEAYRVHEYFDERTEYVDNFWVNIWSQQAQAELYKAAGRVLFIHRNPNTYNALARRAKAELNVEVDFIEMNDWRQGQSVINRAIGNRAPLVLFAGGPALKYISPDIAAHSNKVVLDIGNSVDRWTLLNYKA
jgi:hypothetical protein